MNYEKIGFSSGQVLKAEHMNHIENGITQAENNGNEIRNKINTLINNGGIGYTDDIIETVIVGETEVPLIDGVYDVLSVIPNHWASNYEDILDEVYSQCRFYLYIKDDVYIEINDRSWFGYEHHFGPNEFNGGYAIQGGPVTYSGPGEPPETVIVKMTKVQKDIHHSINKKYIPKDLQLTSQYIDLIKNNGVLIPKNQYERDGWYEFSVPDAMRLLPPGTELIVSFDKINYNCTVGQPEDQRMYFGSNDIYGIEDNQAIPFIGIIELDFTLKDIIKLVTYDDFSHEIGITINNFNQLSQLPKDAYGSLESNSIKFSGNLNGEEIISIDEFDGYIKLLDYPINLDEIDMIEAGLDPMASLSLGFSGNRAPLFKQNWIIETENGNQMLKLINVHDSFDNVPVIMSITNPQENFPAGTFGYYRTSSPGDKNAIIWIAKILYGEKINKINPKYLPEGGVGYTEPTVITILEESIHLPEDNNYRIPTPGIEDGPYNVYINGIKYGLTRNVDSFSYNYYEDEHIYIDFYEDYLAINYRDDTPYDPITVSITQDTEIVHSIEGKYLHNLPERVSLLEADGALVEKGEYNVTDGVIYFNIPNVLTLGMRVKVHFDGNDYDFIVQNLPPSDDGTLAFGNLVYFSPFRFPDTGEPFGCATNNGILVMAVNSDVKTHTVGISIDSSINVARLPKGGIGYSEPNVLTFNGVATEEMIDLYYAKLSDEPIDLNEVIKIRVDVHPLFAEDVGFNHFEVTPNQWIVGNENGNQILFYQDIPALMSITTPGDDGLSVGVWGMVEAGTDSEGNPISYIWLSRVEYGENIHMIDPKYLPDLECTEEIIAKEEKILYSGTLSDNGAFGVDSYIHPFDMAVGRTYIVNLESGKYDVVCKLDTNGYPYLGNYHIIDKSYENTEETFIIYRDDDNDYEYMRILDSNQGNFCTIIEEQEKVEKIYKINPKYLPTNISADITMVDYTTLFASGQALTVDMIGELMFARLNTAIVNNAPFYLNKWKTISDTEKYMEPYKFELYQTTYNVETNEPIRHVFICSQTRVVESKIILVGLTLTYDVINQTITGSQVSSE